MRWPEMMFAGDSSSPAGGIPPVPFDMATISIGIGHILLELAGGIFFMPDEIADGRGIHWNCL
jgi:hypothetical protein